MKPLMRMLALVCVFAIPLALSAQLVAVGNYYTWPAASAVGPVGFDAINAPQGTYAYAVNGASNTIAIDWTVTGTVSACTFRVEGSADAVTWTGLDVTAPSADSVPCTSGNKIGISFLPSKFIRIYIVSWTGTGNVVFAYTGGR